MGRTAAEKTREQLLEELSLIRGLLGSIREAFVLGEIVLDDRGRPVDCRYLEANEPFARQTGRTREEIIGRTCRELAPQTEPFALEEIGRVALSGQPLHLEKYNDEADRWYELDLFCPERGRYAGLFRDITGRRQAEQELIGARDAADAARQRLQAVLDILPVSVIMSDADGRLTAMNAATHEIWGAQAPLTRRPADYGQDYRAWWPASHPNRPGLRVRAREWGLARALTKGERCLAEELDIETHDGRRRTILNYALPIQDEEGRIVGGVAVNVDISERKRIERKLLELNETLEQQVASRTETAERRARLLQALALELVETEERERSRFALLLHEDLQQLLVSARMHLQALAPAEPDRPAVNRLSELLVEAVRKSRSLTHELSPPILKQVGLVACLQWLVQQMRELHGLEAWFETDLPGDDDHGPLKVFLFRAVQELLFNVFRHSGAREARVTLSGPSGRLLVTVEDEGCGFDPQRLQPQAGRPSGFGLFSIRERIDALGGRMEVESAPGRGTRITLNLPHRLADRPPHDTRRTHHGLQKP